MISKGISSRIAMLILAVYEGLARRFEARHTVGSRQVVGMQGLLQSLSALAPGAQRRHFSMA